MSQHDFNIANQTFPSFRADLNNALVAAATMSAGASAPTTPYAYQLWFDTTTGTWKVRNSGNTAWISTITTDLATGSVGIGTSSATSQLSFGANIGRDFAVYEGAGGANKYGIGMSGDGTGGNPFRTKIYANGVENVSITAAGSVGIGVSDPSQAIDLVGSSNSGSGSVRAGGTGSGTQAAFIAQAQFGSASFGTYANYPAVLNSSNSPMVYFNTNASGRAVFAEGITFNGDTAAANALDDYEEGTWTPSPSSGSLLTFSSQWYIKIGNIVTCSFYIYNFSGGTSSSQVMISGLPFAFKTGTEGFFQVGFVGGINSLPTNTISITARIGQHGSNTFALYLGKVGNAYSNFQYSEVGTGHYAATFSYQTA